MYLSKFLKVIVTELIFTAMVLSPPLLVSSHVALATPSPMDEICYQFPEKSDSPILFVCRSDSSLTFKNSYFSDQYSLQDYRTMITNKIIGWSLDNNLSLDLICGGELEVGAFVPEVVPSSYALRVQLKTTNNRVLLFSIAGRGDKDASGRTFKAKNTYPENFGFDIGSLFGQLKEGVSADDISDYLEKFGYIEGFELSSQLITLYTSPLDEEITLSLIKNDKAFSSYFKSIGLNELNEIFGYRGVIDGFELNCD